MCPLSDLMATSYFVLLFCAFCSFCVSRFCVCAGGGGWKVYFSDGDAVEICDDEDKMQKQLDRLEPRGFEKYKAYLDRAQLNLEVRKLFAI